MKMEFNNAKVIVENRKNGVEPAITIIDNDDTVYIVTPTPDGNWFITNEGPVGSRYDSNGKYIKES